MEGRKTNIAAASRLKLCNMRRSAMRFGLGVACKMAPKTTKGRPRGSPFVHFAMSALSVPVFGSALGRLNAHDIAAVQADILQHAIVQHQQFAALTPEFHIAFKGIGQP
jgi:hypothetical protein